VLLLVEVAHVGQCARRRFRGSQTPALLEPSSLCSLLPVLYRIGWVWFRTLLCLREAVPVLPRSRAIQIVHSVVGGALLSSEVFARDIWGVQVAKYVHESVHDLSFTCVS